MLWLKLSFNAPEHDSRAINTLFSSIFGSLLYRDRTIQWLEIICSLLIGVLRHHRTRNWDPAVHYAYLIQIREVVPDEDDNKHDFCRLQLHVFYLKLNSILPKFTSCYLKCRSHFSIRSKAEHFYCNKKHSWISTLAQIYVPDYAFILLSVMDRTTSLPILNVKLSWYWYV